MGGERINNWDEKFSYSLSAQQQFDMSLLKRHIPNCVEIRKTPPEMDKNGIDYVATLENGAEIYIDGKTRTPGASRYWKNGVPELALELWSVKESRKKGWAVSTACNVDYILFTFDKQDCDKYFFIPYQLLRKAFMEHGRTWCELYQRKTQASYGHGAKWHSEAVFVPAPIVLQAVSACMCGLCEIEQRPRPP